MFRGKFEMISESTLTRYQQGGIMVGDIVKINKNALKHDKIKDMPNNMKENIKLLMGTDLHLMVSSITSPHVSQGGMGDGLGLGSTTAPTDFWCGVCVMHSPALKSDPIVLPIEVLERQDFGANLPPIPDSLKRISKITIKPEDASNYNPEGPVYESIEDAMMAVGGANIGHSPSILGDTEEPNVTVRIPLEDTENIKTLLDDNDISWSVVGTNRYELHGKMSVIQPILQQLANACGCEVEVEVVSEPEAPQIPNIAPKSPEIGRRALPVDSPIKNDEEGLEEAYNGVHGVDSIKSFTIEIANVFGENVTRYLATENIDHKAIISGGKTLVTIRSKGTADDIRSDLKKNVMGNQSYIRVYES